MYEDQVKRKLAFLEAHPEWSIVFVRSMGYYEAVRDDPNTVMTDYDLSLLMDRVEQATRDHAGSHKRIRPTKSEHGSAGR